MNFGALAGKYRIQNSDLNSRVAKIEYVESPDVSDKPEFIADKKKFLEEYKSVFTVAFSEASAKPEKLGSAELYHLFADLEGKRVAVGQASFQLDEEGRVLQITVNKIK